MAEPDDDLDPAANTQVFQAFMDRRDEPVRSGSRGVWVALAIVALVIVVALVWLLG